MRFFQFFAIVPVGLRLADILLYDLSKEVKHNNYCTSKFPFFCAALMPNQKWRESLSSG
jgi:hypothetical protein